MNISVVSDKNGKEEYYLRNLAKIREEAARLRYYIDFE